MKRKQFIKQIMGQGIPRNMAAQVAAATLRKGMPYYNGLGLFLNAYALALHGKSPAILYPPAGGGAQ